MAISRWTGTRLQIVAVVAAIGAVAGMGLSWLVNRVDEIQEAYSLTGDADYLLKVVLPDLKSLSDIVNDVLMPHESVAHVRSSIVLDRLKTTRKLPLKKIAT